MRLRLDNFSRNRIKPFLVGILILGAGNRLIRPFKTIDSRPRMEEPITMPTIKYQLALFANDNAAELLERQSIE